jgi:hypothetical protein
MKKKLSVAKLSSYQVYKALLDLLELHRLLRISQKMTEAKSAKQSFASKYLKFKWRQVSLRASCSQRSAILSGI